jgi:hypothetical protein
MSCFRDPKSDRWLRLAVLRRGRGIYDAGMLLRAIQTLPAALSVPNERFPRGGQWIAPHCRFVGSAHDRRKVDRPATMGGGQPTDIMMLKSCGFIEGPVVSATLRARQYQSPSAGVA